MNQKRVLEAIGEEMQKELEWLLETVAPHIYHRPTRILSRVGVVWDGWHFWRWHWKVFLIVQFSLARDFQRIRPMVEEFVMQHRSRSKVAYRVGIDFQVTRTEDG
jgi:hypothetical protein